MGASILTYVQTYLTEFFYIFHDFRIKRVVKRKDLLKTRDTEFGPITIFEEKPIMTYEEKLHRYVLL